MKRVFHIISHLDVGGAERVAVNIAKSVSPGFEYHVVEVVRAHSPFTRTLLQELREAGIAYHRFIVPDIKFHYLFERLAAWLFPFWFIFVFLKYRPAVMHCHSEIPELATYRFFHCFPWLAKRCKVVRTIHNTQLWTGMEGVGRRVERWLQSRNANVAISLSVQESYQRVYGERPPIIYNGVEECVERKDYPAIVSGKINVLFAGRLEEQKGIVHLIDIVTSLKGDSRYFFHIIGDGRLKEMVTAQFADLPNVAIHSPLYGLSAYLPSFDYLLMPSEHEGLSLLSIEASMAGLPVIANDCLGLKDTLPDGWPLLVHGNNKEEYAHLFSTFLPHCDAGVLAEKARRFSEEHFGLRPMQLKYEQCYGR